MPVYLWIFEYVQVLTKAEGVIESLGVRDTGYYAVQCEWSTQTLGKPP